MPTYCIRCKVEPVEDFGDDDPSLQCSRCNDRDIERSNRAREWDYYHPGTPIPKSERDGG